MRSVSRGAKLLKKWYRNLCQSSIRRCRYHPHIQQLEPRVLLSVASDGAIVSTGAIGDYVWMDTNHNGIQDEGEPGIANATVSLYELKPNNYRTKIQQQYSDASGHYRFENLSAGQYYVTVSVPYETYYSPYKSTLSLQGDDATVDSDLSPSRWETRVITLSDHEVVDDLDLGFYDPVPVADAGPDYGLTQGNALELDASGTNDTYGALLTYEWDLDNDGQYDDATGENPLVDWQTFEQLGITEGTYQINLKVTDYSHNMAYDSAMLRITRGDFSIHNDLDDIADGDLPGTVFVDVSSGANAGEPLSSAGDVNGDGFDDFIIAAPKTDTETGYWVGKVYLIYGSAEGFEPQITPEDILSGQVSGAIFEGTFESNWLGRMVCSTGDFNGDGFDDIFIGEKAHLIDEGATQFGYVLYGQQTQYSGEVELSQIKDGTLPGFVLVSEADHALHIVSIVSAGDVNGDHMDDLLLSYCLATDDIDKQGVAYLLYGQNDLSGMVDLNDLITGELDGAILWGANSGSYFAYAISPAGDVNGDGLDDFLIGAYRSDLSAYYGGAAHLVLGSTDKLSGQYILRDAIANGEIAGSSFIFGNTGYVGMGSHVAAAGDVDGDGFDDFILGTNYNRTHLDGGDYQTLAGMTYLIYGSEDGYRSTFDLNGYDNSLSEYSVFYGSSSLWVESPYAGSGDFNGDGFDDIVLHASASSVLDPADQTYVIYGGPQRFDGAILLSELSDGDPAVQLFNSYGRYISHMSFVGDVDGDGKDDLLISYPDYSRSLVYLLNGHSASIQDHIQLSGVSSNYSMNWSDIKVELYDVNGNLVATTLADEQGGYRFDDIEAGDYRIVIEVPEILEFDSEQVTILPSSAGMIRGQSQWLTVAYGSVKTDIGIDLVNPAPVADAGSYISLTLGEDLVFDGSGSRDVGDTELSYRWKVGNEYFYDLGPNPTFTWHDLYELGLNTGTSYLTYLYVTDSMGRSDSATVRFYIKEPTDGSDIFGQVWLDENQDGIQDDSEQQRIEGVTINLMQAGEGICGTTTTDQYGNYVFENIPEGQFYLQAEYPTRYLPVPNNATTDYRSNSDFSLGGLTDVFVTDSGQSLIQVDLGLYNPPPTADAGGPYIFDGNDNYLRLSALLSHDEGDDILSYAWDLDQDGIYESTLERAGFYRSQLSSYGLTTGENTITLQVTDSAGNIAYDTATIIFQDRLPYNTVVLNDAEDGLLAGTTIDYGTILEKNSVFLYSIVNVGDINGDGLEDIVYSFIHRESYSYPYVMSNYLIYGSDEGLPENISLDDLASGEMGGAVLSLDLKHFPYNAKIVGAGDVNGDGCDDLLISDYYRDIYYGEDEFYDVYLVYGSQTELTGAIDITDIASGQVNGAIFHHDTDMRTSGVIPIGAGDINGDGFDDIAIATPYSRIIDQTGSDQGYVRFIYGSVDAPVGVFDFSQPQDDAFASFVLYGYQCRLFGSNITLIGDINHDGFDDLMVQCNPALFGGSDQKAYLIYGQQDKLTGNHSIEQWLDGTYQSVVFVRDKSSDSGFMPISAAGDVNGDGIDDFIIGYPFSDRVHPDCGLAYLVYGSNTNLSGTYMIDQIWDDSIQYTMFYGAMYGTGLGADIQSVSDYNGDGISDLLINGNYLIFGQENMPHGAVPVDGMFSGMFDGMILGEHDDSHYAKSVDFNHDGYSDLIIHRDGHAFVLYGNSKSSVGDTVWFDANANGVQDDDEPGIADVTVYLLDDAQNVIATTVTDENGAYRFAGLAMGYYHVQVVLPSRYLFTQQDALPSDNQSIPDWEIPKVLARQNDDGSLTLYLPDGQLRLEGDVTAIYPEIVYWESEAGNGLQINPSDEFANIIVKLQNGHLVTIPAHFENGDWVIDLDADGDTDIVIIGGGGTIDIGNDGGGIVIGGGSGNNGGGITIIGGGFGGGIIIEGGDISYGGTGVITGVTIGDTSGGFYLAGSNTDTFSTLVHTSMVSLTQQAAIYPDDAIDSDVDPLTGISHRITLSYGKVLHDVDAGMINPPPTADAGDGYELYAGESVTLDASGSTDQGDDQLAYAWDIDGDGEYDDAFGINPQVDWAALYDLQLTDGVYIIGMQATDLDGNTDESFTTLTVYQPDLLGAITDADIANHRFNTQLISPVNDATYAGTTPIAAGDINGDGWGDWLVTVPSDSNTNNSVYLIYGTQKMSAESIQIDGVLNGQYTHAVFMGATQTVNETMTVAPAGDVNDDGYADLYVSLLTAEDTPNQTHLLYGHAASISGYVWDDVDADGYQDDSESAMQQIVVDLLDASGNFLRSTLTDENGQYRFNGLWSGDYAVRYELPRWYQFTSQHETMLAERDSDVDLQTGQTDVISIDSAHQNAVLDAGMLDPTHAPQAAPNLVSTDYQTAINIDVLSNDFDVDGDALVVSQLLSATSEQGVALTINSDSTIHYDPRGVFETLEPGQKIRDIFRYQISDTSGKTDSHIVFVDVTCPLIYESQSSADQHGQHDFITTVSSSPRILANTSGITFEFPVSSLSRVDQAAIAWLGQQARMSTVSQSGLPKPALLPWLSGFLGDNEKDSFRWSLKELAVEENA